MTVKSLLAAAALMIGSTIALPVVAGEFSKVTTLPAELVQPDLAVPLPPADAIAIHELVTRIYLAEDSRDLNALRQLVTEDLVHEHTVYGKLEGVENFVGFVRDNPGAFDRFRHQALNIVTRQTGPDKAEALSYILVLQVHPVEGEDALALPRIIGQGVVRDRLAKVGGRWRIAHRVYDQFSVSAALVPDRAARENYASTIENKDDQ